MTALLVGACGSGETKSEDKATDDAAVTVGNLVELSIPVVGMTCAGCENAVKKSIATLEGIAEVSASHVDSVAVVKYDSDKASEEDIKAKITEAGYAVL